MNESLLFTPPAFPRLRLANRIIRSATYEGLGGPDGMPRPELADLYASLCRGGVGMVITGFAFVSQAGRAMQPGQCGMDSDEKGLAWSAIVAKVKAVSPSTPLIMQLAHAGRQTLRSATGRTPVGASSRPCTYFREKVRALGESEVPAVAEEFAQAARRAQAAGFDGVQIHGAHGYLVHQFLSARTNTRRDRWGDGPLFLETVIAAVQARCGSRFPVLVKLSAEEQGGPGLCVEETLATVRRLERAGVEAVEISIGSMERALDIMRGGCPADLALKVNPLFNRMPRLWLALWNRFRLKAYVRRFIPFTENYNAAAAARIKAAVRIPVYPVGGIRSRAGMETCLGDQGLDAVGLCRPLLCEPDLPRLFKEGLKDRSACTNCNVCTIMCDAPQPVRCRHARERTRS